MSRRITGVLVGTATFLLIAVLWFSGAQAQVPGGGVSQQGTVTPGNCTKWFGPGVIQDSGSTCGGGGSGSPGGSNGQVQFNNAGNFGGLTNTQLTADINVATATLSGALPAWPNTTTTFFRGDGTYVTLNCAALGNSGAFCAGTDAANLTGTVASARLSGAYTGITGLGTIAGLTVTGSLTATGLITNADLVNTATTVNGQSCVLGATCTVAAAAGTLTGTTLASNVVTSSLTSVGTLAGLTVTGSFMATGLVTNGDLVSPTITINSTSCTLGSSCTISGGGGGGITVGATITGTCPNGDVVYSNSGVIGCQAVSGTGTVTQVNSGAGLTGGPVTTTGTISLDLTHANTWTAAQTFNGGVLTSRRTITSGASDTATGVDFLILWDKASGSSSTQNIPACGSSFDGQVFVVKDEKGDAATNNITVTPASGTVEGASTAVINSNSASITLQCDASTTNWIVE